MFVSGVFRCGSSLPMSDLSQLGSSTFVRSFGCPDLLVPVTGMVDSTCLCRLWIICGLDLRRLPDPLDALALHFRSLGNLAWDLCLQPLTFFTLVPLRLCAAALRIESSTSVYGRFCFGPLMLALDFVLIELSLFARAVARLGLAFLVSSRACSEPIMSILDVGWLGSFMPPQSLARPDFSFPMFGRSALGPAMLVLGFATLDSLVLLRAMCHTGSLFSAFGLARFGFSALVSDSCDVGSSFLVRSHNCSELTISVFGLS